MKTNKGFSLVELIIVIAIIGIVATIASSYWQRYINDSNLRTAARDFVSDINNAKQRAIGESRNYRITITTGTPGSYTIEQRNTANTISTVIATKSPSAFGNGLSISSTSFLSNIIYLYPRGTTSAGEVVLQNSRGYSATIKTNITGKVYVTFAMQ